MTSETTLGPPKAKMNHNSSSILLRQHPLIPAWVLMPKSSIHMALVSVWYLLLLCVLFSRCFHFIAIDTYTWQENDSTLLPAIPIMISLIAFFTLPPPSFIQHTISTDDAPCISIATTIYALTESILNLHEHEWRSTICLSALAFVPFHLPDYIISLFPFHRGPCPD